MIIFDLKCDKGHPFEGWFKDRETFQEQRAGRLVSCPVCGSVEVQLSLSAVSIRSKRGDREREGKGAAEVSPMRHLQMVLDFVERHFDNVGDRFAEVALKIHRGEEDQRNIRGTTTSAEEEVLREEGVPFMKIPEPKFDS